MSSSPIPTADSNPNLPAKPLSRSYDGRKPSPQSLAAREREAQKRANRPKIKRVSKRDSANLLNLINHKAEWPRIYRAAFESKDLRLCVEILKYLTDRRDGRPFVAENPNARAGNRTPDPNLLIAVNNLTVNNTGKSKKHKPVIQNGASAIDSQAISTQSAGDLPALPVASSDASTGIQQPIQAAKNPGDGERK